MSLRQARPPAPTHASALRSMRPAGLRTERQLCARSWLWRGFLLLPHAHGLLAVSETVNRDCLARYDVAVTSSLYFSSETEFNNRLF